MGSTGSHRSLIPTPSFRSFEPSFRREDARVESDSVNQEPPLATTLETIFADTGNCVP